MIWRSIARVFWAIASSRSWRDCIRVTVPDYREIVRRFRRRNPPSVGNGHASQHQAAAARSAVATVAGAYASVAPAWYRQELLCRMAGEACRIGKERPVPTRTFHWLFRWLTKNRSVWMVGKSLKTLVGPAGLEPATRPL